MAENFRKYGKSPFSVVLVHGGPGAAQSLQMPARVLSQKSGVVEALQTRKSIAGQIQELAQQVETAAHLPATLLGHSWGAWLALLLANHKPQIVRKLILVSTPPFEKQPALNQNRMQRLSSKQRTLAEKLMKKAAQETISDHEFGTLGRLMEIADSFHYTPQTDHTQPDFEIFRAVWAEAAQFRESGKLIRAVAQIKCPVVAIHGAFDSHPLENVEKTFSELLEDFKMIRLENCGHTPWKEKYSQQEFFERVVAEI